MKRRRICWFVIAILSFCCLLPLPALADVNNFTVTNFSADYYLDNTDPQGHLHVIEQIFVNFTDQNHGILRAVPSSYHNHPLHFHINRVTSSSGAPTTYTVSSQNGNEVIKIGDPNRTITGPQEYTVDYSLDNVITLYPDHDELYWDINGDQWNQPFTIAQMTLHLASGLKLSSQKPQCYAGSYGSTSQDCEIRFTSRQVTAIAANLSSGQTLTVVTGFTKGYFRAMTWRDYLQDYGIAVLELLLPILVLGGGGFIWWLKKGRDAKGTGVIIPQYEAPDKLTPLEVGAIIHFSVADRDITATIIDMAIRKYLRIIETDKVELIGKAKIYSLQLLNNDTQSLNTWEQSLLLNIFAGVEPNSAIPMSALRAKLYQVSKTIRKSVDRSLTDRGYFKSDPIRFLFPLGIIIIIVWFLVPPIALSNGLAIGLVIGLLLLGIFYHFMPARSAKGVVAKEHILGLKLFLGVTESDRLAKLQSPGAPYAAPSHTPEHTVELFETLLPLAIVLGVEKQWAAKFAGLYTEPPQWFQGNGTAFSTAYLIGALDGGFGTAVTSAFASPSAASGSGFGGGFAGGGGGGGGGGGW